MRNKLSLKKIGAKIIDISYTLSLWFVGLVVLYIVIQVFVLTSFSIPTDSMEPSIVPGDKILVEKLSMGGRLFNLQKAFNDEPFTISRAPGFSKLKRNDVIVFNWPYRHTWDVIEFDLAKYYVKRCVGLPGDTIQIQDAIFFVHGIDIPLGNVEGQKRLQQQLAGGREHAGQYWGIYWVAYPHNDSLDWSIQNFGPFYIPRKGDKIDMNYTNYLLYSRQIEWEQQQPVAFRDDKVWVGSNIVSTYEFQNNYYFVSGDKVENSQDSRYWGVLPESFIVGKAWRILYSKDRLTGRYRKERFLKKMNN